MPAGQEEAVVAMILEGLAAKIHELVGVRMHRLAVCEWEVKLWLDSVGLARGAWRIAVTNVTGHTCTVNVSSSRPPAPVTRERKGEKNIYIERERE